MSTADLTGGVSGGVKWQRADPMGRPAKAPDISGSPSGVVKLAAAASAASATVLTTTTTPTSHIALAGKVTDDSKITLANQAVDPKAAKKQATNVKVSQVANILCITAGAALLIASLFCPFLLFAGLALVLVPVAIMAKDAQDKMQSQNPPPVRTSQKMEEEIKDIKQDIGNIEKEIATEPIKLAKLIKDRDDNRNEHVKKTAEHVKLDPLDSNYAAKKAALEDEIQKLDQEHADLEQQIKASPSKIDSLKKKLTDLQNQKQKIEDEKALQDAKKAIGLEKKRVASEGLPDRGMKIKELNLQKKILEKEAEITNLTKEMNKNSVTLKRKRDEIKKISDPDEKQALQAEITKLENRQVGLQKKIGKLEGDIQRINNRIEALKAPVAAPTAPAGSVSISVTSADPYGSSPPASSGVVEILEEGPDSELPTF